MNLFMQHAFKKIYPYDSTRMGSCCSISKGKTAPWIEDFISDGTTPVIYQLDSKVCLRVRTSFMDGQEFSLKRSSYRLGKKGRQWETGEELFPFPSSIWKDGFIPGYFTELSVAKYLLTVHNRASLMKRESGGWLIDWRGTKSETCRNS